MNFFELKVNIGFARMKSAESPEPDKQYVFYLENTEPLGNSIVMFMSKEQLLQLLHEGTEVSQQS